MKVNHTLYYMGLISILIGHDSGFGVVGTSDPMSNDDENTDMLCAQLINYVDPPHSTPDGSTAGE